MRGRVLVGMGIGLLLLGLPLLWPGLILFDNGYPVAEGGGTRGGEPSINISGPADVEASPFKDTAIPFTLEFDDWIANETVNLTANSEQGCDAADRQHVHRIVLVDHARFLVGGGIDDRQRGRQIDGTFGWTEHLANRLVIVGGERAVYLFHQLGLTDLDVGRNRFLFVVGAFVHGCRF